MKITLCNFGLPCLNIVLLLLLLLLFLNVDLVFNPRNVLDPRALRSLFSKARLHALSFVQFLSGTSCIFKSPV